MCLLVCVLERDRARERDRERASKRESQQVCVLSVCASKNGKAHLGTIAGEVLLTNLPCNQMAHLNIANNENTQKKIPDVMTALTCVDLMSVS